MERKQLEKILKALGDVNRLGILSDMSEGGGCIKCSSIIDNTDLAQPSVSHHIKTLVEAGLIKPEKEGRTYSYKLNSSLFKAFLEQLGSMAGLALTTKDQVHSQTGLK